MKLINYCFCLNKRQRKPKEQSRMHNPETLATLGTHDMWTKMNQKKEEKRTMQKAKQMSNTDPYQNARARKGLAVPTSYKKPTVLLIVK